MKSPAALQRIAARLPGERYVVDRPVDAEGKYQLELTGEFPLAVNGRAEIGEAPVTDKLCYRSAT